MAKLLLGLSLEYSITFYVHVPTHVNIHLRTQLAQLSNLSWCQNCLPWSLKHAKKNFCDIETASKEQFLQETSRNFGLKDERLRNLLSIVSPSALPKCGWKNFFATVGKVNHFKGNESLSTVNRTVQYSTVGYYTYRGPATCFVLMPTLPHTRLLPLNSSNTSLSLNLLLRLFLICYNTVLLFPIVQNESSIAADPAWYVWLKNYEQYF